MDLDELLDRGWEALELGAADDAHALAEQALRGSPELPEALDLRARALVAQGDDARATAEWAELRRRFRDQAWPLLGAADHALALGDEDPQALERAAELAQQAHRKARDDAERHAALLLKGVALARLQDDRAALAALDRALQLVPDSFEARLEKAQVLFDLCRFDDAQALAEALSSEDTEEPLAWHLLGLLAERAGDDRRARRLLAKATALDPEAFPAPVPLREGDFDRAVQDALAALPPLAKQHLGNVTVSVAPFPSLDDLDGGELSPGILGVFRGTPVGSRSVASAMDHATAEIVLFQRNLERFARTREELVEQIGVTVAHEVGHLLGLDEDDLFERGLD